MWGSAVEFVTGGRNVDTTEGVEHGCPLEGCGVPEDLPEAAEVFGVGAVEVADFFGVVRFEPADGDLAGVVGAFFACEAGDEVRGFVRVVIVRL